MGELTPRDVNHIFEALRKGLVPERGIDAFAVGTEDRRREIKRQLELAEAGEGGAKFLRGGYGCGKTFTARMAVLDAQEKGFVTSFVVVSDNDLHFHRFDNVYRKVMSELSTSSCPRGALGDILDRWIGNVEDALVSGGEDPNDKGFDAKVRARIEADLAGRTNGAIPGDFVRVVQAIFDLKQKGQAAEAGALVSWLCGSENVAASAKAKAGVKGDIGSSDALAYLRGVLEICKAAGYKGLLIVVDEAETILRMRSDSRKKSLNGIRQIVDASVEQHGLLWLFTGTEVFFDDKRHGVASLPPLDDRIRFVKTKFPNHRQPQIELVPFDKERLMAVAKHLRALFRSPNKARIEATLNDAFIERLTDDVTAGFKGDVGVVPRQFLRAFVMELDTVDQHEAYNPMEEHGFKVPPASELPAEEQHALSGQALSIVDADDGPTPVEDAW